MKTITNMCDFKNCRKFMISINECDFRAYHARLFHCELCVLLLIMYLRFIE